MQSIPEVKHITFPHPPGAGGPGTFQTRFENELKKKAWVVSYADKKAKPDIVFVVGGTRKLLWLWKMKRKGIPIIYRLDGIPWLHRKKKTSFKTYIKVELMIMINKLIHGFLASHIVYQSEFVKKWWDQESWHPRKDFDIIYNAVPIPTYEKQNKIQEKRLVVLEGVVDYTPYAVKLLNDLASTLPEDISIEIYGKFEDKTEQNKLVERLQYKGFVARKDVDKVLKGAVYLSLDINPACPNTVIEAMAQGSPVVAFDTGALPELVKKNCGKIIDYGSNPWNLDYPDVNNLSIAITSVFSDYDYFAKHAYQYAQSKFNLNQMTKSYLSIMNNLIEV